MIDYRKMRVWERAHAFVLRTYDLTKSFPNSELYGLTSQLRRAAVSIPAILAEGSGKNTDPEFSRYVDIASGSASETDYLILLAKDLKYNELDVYEEMAQEITVIRKMITSLKKAIKSANSD